MTADATLVEPCRVIIDPLPGSGRWNMAVDEALLESAVAGGGGTTRWYRWEEATLSLGYFQPPQDALRDRRFAGLPVVRRLTGGGAIVHQYELTYSCVLPASHPLAGNWRALYTTVHETMVHVLSGLGFNARLRGTADGARRAEFLCFGRGDDFDVIMGGSKVLGSAQRRRKGAVLQHGSLLLRRSEWTCEFPGIFDCAGRVVSEADLTEQLSRAVGALVCQKAVTGCLSKDEKRRAAQLMHTCEIPPITPRQRAEDFV
jgi:lipoate-protein ligase A